MGVSLTVLIAAQQLDETLSAQEVGDALSGGLQAAGLPAPVVFQLDGEDARALDVERLDAEMKASRAVLIAAPKLDERTLLRSASFEMATRARQAGVPCYAVAAQNELEPFDARILDLQIVLEAATREALLEAGRKLGEII